MTSRHAPRKPRVGNVVASAHELQWTYEAALDERRKSYGAAPTTVEAVMYSLRERGEPALTETDCQRRLSELSLDRLRQVIVRLDRMRAEYPAITDSLLLRLGEKIP
jgi:hypothetical protein